MVHWQISGDRLFLSSSSTPPPRNQTVVAPLVPKQSTSSKQSQCKPNFNLDNFKIRFLMVTNVQINASLQVYIAPRSIFYYFFFFSCVTGVGCKIFQFERVNDELISTSYCAKISKILCTVSARKHCNSMTTFQTDRRIE